MKIPSVFTFCAWYNVNHLETLGWGQKYKVGGSRFSVQHLVPYEGSREGCPWAGLLYHAVTWHWTGTQRKKTVENEKLRLTPKGFLHQTAAALHCSCSVKKGDVDKRKIFAWKNPQGLKLYYMLVFSSTVEEPITSDGRFILLNVFIKDVIFLSLSCKRFW